MQPDIPDDLYRYLSDGSPLELHFNEGEVREVTLYSLDELRLKTFDVSTTHYYFNGELEEDTDLTYEFSGADLVKSCNSYDPKGIFIWFPALSAYGTWDADHHTIQIYPNKSWSEIIPNPTWYFNGQWEPEKVENQYLKPWIVK